MKEKLPICVDLDGTLIRNDISIETALKFMSSGVIHIFKLIYWLCYGIAYTKYRISQYIDINPSELDYNNNLLMFLKIKKREGYKLFLATGSTMKYANQIADYLKIFSDVFASNQNNNLIAKNKAQKLEQVFGNKGFIYVGNSIDDIPVWKKAKQCLVVSPNSKVIKSLKNMKYLLID